MVLSPRRRFEAPDRSFSGHRDIVTRSVARYSFVAPYLRGVIADIGCGRGYGLEVIRSRGTARIGIDVSQRFLREARIELSTMPLVNASGNALPFSAGSFDSIVCFEVIEHIEDDSKLLSEIRRVARDNAFAAISTPNGRISSGGAPKPLNPFHTREYSSAELCTLLNQVFSSVRLFGQHDRTENDSPAKGLMSLLIDRIPARWKYILPAHVQGLISVALRPPLRGDECRFETSDLHNAHSFIALCRV